MKVLVKRMNKILISNMEEYSPIRKTMVYDFDGFLLDEKYMIDRPEFYEILDDTSSKANVIDDYTSSGHRRFTCTVCQHSLVHQPYMTKGFWDELVESFLRLHEAKNHKDWREYE